MDTDEVAGSDSLESGSNAEPLSVVDSVSQIRQMLDAFTAKCDVEMLRVKDEYLAKRPRLSWFTIVLAVVVLGITTLTSCVMLSTGAETGHLLLSSIGELFLFGLVIASGLTDLLWRDPTKLLQAREDQLARISGIEDEIIKLAEMRQEWQKDVEWHRDKSGEAREQLAQLELESADVKSEIEQSTTVVENLKQQEEELAARSSAAESAAQSVEQALVELSSVQAERTVELDELSGQLEQRKATIAELEISIGEYQASITEYQDSITKHQSSIQELEESAVFYEESLLEQQNQLANLEKQVAEANLFAEELQQQSASLTVEIDRLDSERELAAQRAHLAQEELNRKEIEVAAAISQLGAIVTKTDLANEIVEKQSLALQAIQEKVERAAEVRTEALVTAESENALLDGLSGFATHADRALELLESRLGLAERYWENASTVLYGLEFDISDRQQISDALTLQSRMFEDHLRELENRISLFEHNIAEKHEKLEQLEAEISQRQTLVEQLDCRLQKADLERVSIVQDLEETRQTVFALKLELQSDVSLHDERRQEISDAITALEQQNELKSSELDSLAALLETKTTDFQRCEEDLSLRLEQLNELQSQIQFADSEREQKIKLLLGLRTDVKGLADEVTAVLNWQRQSVAAIEAEIAGRRDHLDEQNQLVDGLRQQLLELEQQTAAAELNLQNIEGKVAKKSSDLEQLTGSLQVTQGELGSTVDQLRSSQMKHDRLRNLIYLLSGQLEEMQLECSVAVGAQHDQIADFEDQVSDAAERLSFKLSEIEQVEAELVAIERNRLQIEDKSAAMESTLHLQQEVLRELAESIAAQNRELERTTEEVSRLEGGRHALLADVQNQNAELHDLLEKSAAAKLDYEERKGAYESELASLLADVQQRQMAADSLQVQFETLSGNLDTLQRQLAEADVARLDKLAEITSLESEIAALKSDHDANVEALSVVHGEKRSEIDRVEQELANLCKTLVEMQTQLSTLNSQNAERLRYAEALDRDVRQAELALGKIQDGHSIKLQELEQLEREARELEEQILENKHALADIADDVDTQREFLVTRTAESEAVSKQLEIEVNQLSASRDELDAVIVDLRSKIDETQQELDELERSRIVRQTESEEQVMKIELNRQELELLADEIGSKQQELAALESQLAESLQAAEEAEERAASVLLEYQLKEQQILGLEGELGEHESKVLDLRAQIDLLQNQVLESEASLKEKQDSIESQTQQAKTIEDELTEQSQRLESLRHEVLEADQLSKQWQAYVAELRQQKDAAETKRDQLTEQVAALELELIAKERQSSEQVAHLQATFDKRSEELKSLDRQIEERREQSSKIELERVELESECAQLRSAIQVGQDDVAKLTARVEELRADQQQLETASEKMRAAAVEREEASNSLDHAEMALGRVEGLVSELQTENQTEIQTEVSETADIRPENTSASLKVELTSQNRVESPKSVVADPWDDVLS